MLFLLLLLALILKASANLVHGVSCFWSLIRYDNNNLRYTTNNDGSKIRIHDETGRISFVQINYDNTLLAVGHQNVRVACLPISNNIVQWERREFLSSNKLTDGRLCPIVLILFPKIEGAADPETWLHGELFNAKYKFQEFLQARTEKDTYSVLTMEIYYSKSLESAVFQGNRQLKATTKYIEVPQVQNMLRFLSKL